MQGQRDFFGAHTYKRIDKDGTFHTLWSGDRTEIATEGSSHWPPRRRPGRGCARGRSGGGCGA